jgi:hypothetical protein
LRSNVLSPHRYLRLGDLSARNIKIYFKSVAKTIGFPIDAGDYQAGLFNGLAGYYEVETIKGFEDDPLTEWSEKTEDEKVTIPYSFSRRAGPNRLLVENSSYFSSPLFINKSIDYIAESAREEIEKRINYLNQSYIYDGLFKNATEIVYFRKENLSVYQVILIYKETLGDKLIMKNVYENISLYNSILVETALPTIDGSPPDITLKKEMTEEEAYSILGISTDDLAGINKIVDLQGFA